VTSGHANVGIRIPNHPLSLELLSQLNFPLAAPSANPFGYVSPTTAQHVADQLGDKVAYILDGGRCQVGIESTIIDLSSKKAKILRLRGLSVADLEAVPGEKIAFQGSSCKPQGPGMLIQHYAPNKKSVLGDINAHIARCQPEK